VQGVADVARSLTSILGGKSDGQRMAVEQRLADIRARYGPAHPVTRALARSAPQLTAATNRVARKLLARTETAAPVRVAQALAF
jgi:hypothetical protein